MTTHLAVTAPPSGLRVRPWHRDRRVAHLTLAGTDRVDPAAIARAVAPLADEGYRAVLTPALAAPEQAPFVAAGFEVVEALHLLERHLDPLPTADPIALGRIRRARRRDLDSVVATDLAAFGPTFWHLGRDGLTETVHATPWSRFRVVDGPDGTVAAYGIWGRAARLGYLQRLAVHPEHQRHGLARALVVDGLQWLRRRRAQTALVNTQPTNRRALVLYDALGFTRSPSGLAVLGLELRSPPAE